MNSRFKRSIIVFFVSVIVLLLIFFLLPINIFDGEIVYKQGLVFIKEQRPLSLHFVSGLEYTDNELKGIKDYYLLPKGYITAFLFIFCLPALVAYRIYLGKNRATDDISENVRKK
jgi:hypothetical protein